MHVYKIYQGEGNSEVIDIMASCDVNFKGSSAKQTNNNLMRATYCHSASN